jgi:hypothetical protein
MSSRERAMEEGISHEAKKGFSEPFDSHELHKVAKYLSRDSDLWVFRRFGTLHLFNILHIQQRLTSLECELTEELSNGTNANFSELIPNIQHTLKEYGKLGNLHYQTPFFSYFTASVVRLERGVCLSNLISDDALSAQAKYRSYREPETHVLEHMEEWSNGNYAALRIGLNIDKERKCLKDIASIAAIEKSWTHRFIDRHACLRSLFVEVSAATVLLQAALIRFACSWADMCNT